MMKVFVLNTLGLGQETLEMLSQRLSLSGVIGLSERPADDRISDYLYQADYCSRKGIPFEEVHSYNLSDDADKDKLLALDIDVLVVLGWQRLIPQWLIEHCNYCAIGSHGSPLGITRGRGRSPQNWALLLGMESFEISIFEIDPGIDSGRVIDTRHFEYGPYDDIKTSYYKVSLLTSEMIADAVLSPEFKEMRFSNQSHGDAEYFPQRTPADGCIDWQQSNEAIARLVRALTRPYPGADSLLDGQKVKIWSAIPFNVDVKLTAEPGEIVNVFNGKDVLVKAGKGFVLVTEYEAQDTEFSLTAGSKFTSVGFTQKLRQIVDRHRSRYPELPVADVILNLLAEPH